jgi:hypothetical protein
MNTEAIQLAIVALVAGISIPLLVQLFLTARTVQRVSVSVEHKLDESRRELHDLLAGVRSGSGASEWSSALASAAVPAIIAAVRAFRTSLTDPREAAVSRNHQEQEKSS